MPPQQPTYEQLFGFVPHVTPQGGQYVYPGGYINPANPMGPTVVKGLDFTDESIRKVFIRKVYSILLVRN